MDGEQKLKVFIVTYAVGQFVLLPLIVIGLIIAGAWSITHQPAAPVDWRGSYLFEEPNGLGTVKVEIYSFTENQENRELRASVFLLQSGTSRAFQCSVKPKNAAAQLNFQKELDGQTPVYQPNTTVFTLSKEGDLLYTHWGAMLPVVPEHKTEGVWFRKVG